VARAVFVVDRQRFEYRHIARRSRTHAASLRPNSATRC
jgi:hypothetical protein